MDCTTLALKLIKAYNKENNRYRRAIYKQNKIVHNTEYQVEMGRRGLSHRTSFKIRKGSSYRRAYNYFENVNPSERYTFIAFVSEAIKNKELRAIQQHINALRVSEQAPTALQVREKDYQELKAKPVLTKLGAMWREYIDAVVEMNGAYETRWEARCAIKAFNKMETGIEIRFGNCSRHGGSMSYIHHVVIDGDKIPLRKFIDNAEFESAILDS